MRRLPRIGWWLFLLSAALFTVAGVIARDWWVVAGSVAFGVACVLFLVDGE